MFDPSSVSTVCASAKIIVPAVAWSQTSNCAALPVLLAGKELPSGDNGRNFELGSSARSSRPAAKTKTKLRNQTLLCFMIFLLMLECDGL
jgi:hypothetical protein